MNFKKIYFKVSNLIVLLLVGCSLMVIPNETVSSQDNQVSNIYIPILFNDYNFYDYCNELEQDLPSIPNYISKIVYSIASHSTFFVTVNGNPNGDGSINDPWDLDSALLESSRVGPGDIIWVRGGIYHPTVEPHKYNIKISGNEVDPIIVRAYPDERVTIDGGIEIYSPNVVFWGFEVFSSDLDRVSQESGSVPSDLKRPGGIAIYNKNVALINNIVHDGGLGITAQNDAENAIIYGNLSYNTGWLGPDRGHGHGYYGQNDIGTKYIYENIIFNNFSNYNYHIYGESVPLNNFIFYGNVSMNGTFLVGGYQPASNITLTENYTYNSTTRLGYRSEDNETVTVLRNHFRNLTSGALEVKWWKNANISDNCIYSKNDILTLLQYPSSPNTYIWNDNLYHSTQQSPFFLSNTTVSWAYWKNSTGFDTGSDFNTSLPTGQDIIIRPNLFEDKRGNIIVYNWSNANSVTVDISKLGLVIGDKYTIHNAQDFYEKSIEGIYDGHSITIPMNGWSSAIPIGWNETLGENTFPNFGVFVIITNP